MKALPLFVITWGCATSPLVEENVPPALEEPTGFECGGGVDGELRNLSLCSAIGEQRVAVIVLTGPGGTANPTPEQIDEQFFGAAPPTLASFIADMSFGQTTISGSVYGPYALDRAYDCTEYYAVRDKAIALADADVTFTDFDRLVIFFPAPTCSWNGQGTIGCDTLLSGDGEFAASTSWIVTERVVGDQPRRAAVITAHELGHNFGLAHAVGYDFNSETISAPGTRVSASEYGDVHSVMGNARLFDRFAQVAAPHKWHLGWLGDEHITDVQSDGVYLVKPYETLDGDGARALKIRRSSSFGWIGAADALWIEYRQPIGDHDTTMWPAGWNGALIHYDDGFYYPGNPDVTALLDLTPGSTANDLVDATLAVGQSWTDPYTGLRLDVSAQGSDLAIGVTYGTASCVAQLPTVTVSGPPAVVAGQPFAVTATITNRDTGTCSAVQEFSRTVAAPSGWGSNTAMVAVPFAGSTMLSLPLTVKTTATVGDYPVSVRSERTAPFGESIANTTVSVLPTVTHAIPGTQFSRNAIIPLTASVKSGGIGVAGAAVLFTLKKPNNQTQTLAMSTDAGGLATWNVQATAKGTYTLTARGTVSGKSNTTAPTTFTVK